MNSFWKGFEKTANFFSKIKPGINIQHSFSPKAEAQVEKIVNMAHDKFQNLITNDLKNTLHEASKHFGEAKKFRARDVLIPTLAAGFGVGLGHRIGKKMGKTITEEPQPTV